MSRTMTICAAAVASGLATFSLLSGFSTTEASGNSPVLAETAAHAQNRGENQRETFDGRVVDLYTYMTQQEDPSENRDRDSMQDRPADADENRARQHKDNPVGIIVTKEGILGESETLHVLLFEPNTSSADQPSASQCRKKIGKTVQLVGRKVERNDVTAIVVEQVRDEATRPERPNRERPSNDRNQPSRNR